MSTPRRRPRPGYSFTDLIILLVILLLLGGVLIPKMHRARTIAERVQCASNLRQIGQAMTLYANANAGQYPRVRWNEANPAPWQYTNWGGANPFSNAGPVRNDVTAAFFLLLRTQDISSAVFCCPSDPTAQPWNFGGVSAANQRSNFPSGASLSYSLQNCYPGAAAVKDNFTWTSPLKPDFVIAADMNPGTNDILIVTPLTTGTALQRANSGNHLWEGQNVLYGDMHVQWSDTCFAGIQKDNIYGAGKLNGDGTIDPIAYAIVAPPAHSRDSVLLPTASGKQLPLPPSRFSKEGEIYWFTYAALLALVAIIAAFLLALRKPSRLVAAASARHA